ncbi:MAG: hypothetical protein QW087_07745 [Methanomassiliicoccales archaeon]
MSSDQSISRVIFFVAAVVAATAIAGALIAIANSTALSIRQQGDLAADRMNTGIRIVNDPRIVPTGNGTVTFYVLNIGSKELETSKLTAFVDGLYAEPVAKEVVAGARWMPGKILALTVRAELNGGDHWVKVVLDNGNFDMMEFRT